MSLDVRIRTYEEDEEPITMRIPYMPEFAGVGWTNLLCR